jgi:hypothetical protein
MKIRRFNLPGADLKNDAGLTRGQHGLTRERGLDQIPVAGLIPGTQMNPKVGAHSHPKADPDPKNKAVCNNSPAAVCV